jgi:hypothetical protein
MVKERLISDFFSWVENTDSILPYEKIILKCFRRYPDEFKKLLKELSLKDSELAKDLAELSDIKQFQKNTTPWDIPHQKDDVHQPQSDSYFSEE